MLRLPAMFSLSAALLCALLTASNSFAQTVRYFGVWSYNQNAPAQEIAPEDLAGRSLGYWAVGFDESGGVVSGTYHGSNGAAWLSFWYEDADGRVYAKLYSSADPDPANLVNRKSTQLSDRMPKWADPPEDPPRSGE